MDSGSDKSTSKRLFTPSEIKLIMNANEAGEVCKGEVKQNTKQNNLECNKRVRDVENNYDQKINNNRLQFDIDIRRKDEELLKKINDLQQKENDLRKKDEEKMKMDEECFKWKKFCMIAGILCIVLLVVLLYRR